MEEDAAPVVAQPALPEEAPSPDERIGFTPQSWIVLVEELAISGITGNLLANCIPDSQDDSSLSLILDESQSSLFNEEQLRRITQSLCQHLGKELRVNITIGSLSAESPARYRQRMKEERIQEAIRNFENDENVQAVIQHFSAHIQQGSVSIANEVKS